jgi:hypothetical protein
MLRDSIWVLRFALVKTYLGNDLQPDESRSTFGLLAIEPRVMGALVVQKEVARGHYGRHSVFDPERFAAANAPYG